MALAKQMIDPKIWVVVHVDPVFFADTIVDDKSTVVILMRVEDCLGDVVLCERAISYVRREFADRNIADVVVSYSVLCRVLRRRRLLLLTDISDIANRQSAICPCVQRLLQMDFKRVQNC